jgi:hypothetical protein
MRRESDCDVQSLCAARLPLKIAKDVIRDVGAAKLAMLGAPRKRLADLNRRLGAR